MGFFARLFGRSRTPLLDDASAWSFQDGTLTLEVERVGALEAKGSAVRIEAERLPAPVLIVHGADDGWYAFRNKCAHGGRRIDVLPGTMQIECCSVGKSTYDYEGKVVGGAAKEDILRYASRRENGRLVVELTS